MYFFVTLALKILIYASVNCGFSGFAGLKLHLFIQPLKRKEMTNLLFSHLPQIITYRNQGLILLDNACPVASDIVAKAVVSIENDG